ncbi:MAG TPA: histidine kinase [Nocardioides sp.]|nr:histidine kinase [Nocardioides sp.]
MTAPADDWERWRPWLPDAGAGLVVFLLGLWEMHGDRTVTSAVGELLVVVGVAVAVGLSRHAPGGALAVAWLTGGVHIVTGTGPMVIEVALAVVAFGCARWGSEAVVWLSGVSIPVAAAIAVTLLDASVLYDALDTTGIRVLAGRAYDGTNGWRVPAGLLGTALLMAPWLLGLALRFSAGSQASRASQVVAEAERDQAEEIARLREEQARLARDVHDVVGHSLAVILAQAESAQFLDGADTAGLKRTMANIATSARSSLDDVRTVLASTQGVTSASARQPDLESLLDGVRASGHIVDSAVVGTAQPLPPELEVVAFRVLQEMLTNAIKHGRRDQPVLVERHWGEDLRIEVQNALPADVPSMDETQPLVGVARPASAGGQGIDGMRRRLEAVGGRLDVRRRTDPPTFTATAWVPVRVVA